MSHWVSAHLPGYNTLPELAPSRRFGGCREFIGPFPPSLLMRVCDFLPRIVAGLFGSVKTGTQRGCISLSGQYIRQAVPEVLPLSETDVPHFTTRKWYSDQANRGRGRVFLLQNGFVLQLLRLPQSSREWWCTCAAKCTILLQKWWETGFWGSRVEVLVVSA